MTNAGRDPFKRGVPGGCWIVGGDDCFVGEERRALLSRMVEKGELQLFGNTGSPFCRRLPLTLVDFTLLEKPSGKCLLVDPASWREACRVLAMYAALAGVSRGLGVEAVSEQSRRVGKLEACW